ncbi:uncharacterized protein LOC128983160 isoform X3 [Macrosteles quadrilineatus]|uniref:uncharacterized protein LOC128983160 isoform X3 n=1 Tax=Macrosteles quadrilineatus TaxID=74068 RepID=UPI0023E2D0AB|nr:uncharacterized protein LOC128983160 isoform X3 [Macrosteles quadrilineatus]
MESDPEAKSQPEGNNDGFSFPPHPTDPDGVVVPPPTKEQMAQGRIRCKRRRRDDGTRASQQTPSHPGLQQRGVEGKKSPGDSSHVHSCHKSGPLQD